MKMQERRDLVRQKLGAEKEFVMGHFFGTTSFRQECEILQGDLPKDCGTSCCIAGTAVWYLPKDTVKVTNKLLEEGLLEKYNSYSGEYTLLSTADHVSESNPLALVAAKLLGVPTSLFYADDWEGDARDYRISALERRDLDDDFDNFDELPHEDRKEVGLKVLDYYFSKYPVPEGE